ncbi:MAG: GxxExxY protein [Chloroflexota bacterium]
MSLQELSAGVIGACIAVHRELGPGLLESAYEECLCYELKERRIKFARQQPLPIVYKGSRLDCGYILDVIVENSIIVELKSVETLLPIHEAQLLTYLKLANLSLGLLINFNVTLLKTGIRRIANNYKE